MTVGVVGFHAGGRRVGWLAGCVVAVSEAAR